MARFRRNDRMVDVGCRNAGDGWLRRRRQQFRFHDHDELFARGAYPDQKIVLTEKSSKKISEQKGHVGSREKTTTTFSKNISLRAARLGRQPEADIVMKCIE